MGDESDDSLSARVAALERLVHLAFPAAVAIAMLIVPVARHDTTDPSVREPAWQLRSLLGLIVDYEADGRAQTIAYGALIVTAVCLVASIVVALISLLRGVELRGLLLATSGLGVPAGLLAWYLTAVFIHSRDDTIDVFGAFVVIPAVLAWLFASAEGRAAFRQGGTNPD